MNATGGKSSKLILAAMIFAVAMMFIDQTIVAIAVPSIQDDLSLSATGVQWIINGYLLSRRCSPSAAASPTSPATARWS
jgi:MFS family permease